MPGVKSVKFFEVQNSKTKALDSASQLGPALGNCTLFQHLSTCAKHIDALLPTLTIVRYLRINCSYHFKRLVNVLLMEFVWIDL